MAMARAWSDKKRLWMVSLARSLQILDNVRNASPINFAVYPRAHRQKFFFEP